MNMLHRPPSLSKRLAPSKRPAEGGNNKDTSGMQTVCQSIILRIEYVRSSGLSQCFPRENGRH